MSNTSRIEFFPITLFAVVMGLSGLSIVYEKAHHLFHISSVPFVVLLALSSLIFVINLSLYSYKMIKHIDVVKSEFFHPVRMNFFPAISISMLLLSIAYYSYLPSLATVLWSVGTVLHTVLTFYIFSYWIQNNFEIHHSNPAWFIPIVGNVIIPVIGVDIVGSEPMMFYFSIGIFFWVVLFTIMLYRIIFHNQLAEKFIPTLFILIAPPAVGLISYTKITQSYDFFAIFLLDIAFFFTILLFSMGRSFLKIRFFVSWWAFTFPLDAITLATMVAYKFTQNPLYEYISYLLIAITTVVISVVAYQTLLHINKREICVDEK